MENNFKHTHDIVSMKKLSPAIKDYSNMWKNEKGTKFWKNGTLELQRGEKRQLILAQMCFMSFSAK